MVWGSGFRRATGAVLVAFIVSAGLVMGIAPALATSCSGNGPSVTERLALGPVFVGTVVSTRNGGTWGTFAVEEVWSGDVPEAVEVKAGSQHDVGGGKFQSIGGEQAFTPGQRYLVTAAIVPAEEGRPDGPPWFGEPGDIVMPICAPLLDWTEGFASSRPELARIITRAEPIEIIGEVPGPFAHDPNEGPPWPWIGAISIFLVIVGAGGLLAWRAGRKDDPVDDAEIEGLIDHDRHRAGLD